MQDTKREWDRWEEACQYWKHKYKALYEAHMQTLTSLLCDVCRSSDRQELCNAWSLMEEVYVIPQQELDQLIQYYKGELTENALLNKAMTLAAKKHVLLSEPYLPTSLVNAKTKPISWELTKLTK